MTDMTALINQIAPLYGIPVDLMTKLGTVESGLNPAAIGDGGWSHGAWQIYLKAHPHVTAEQAHDPMFSTRYAAQLLSGAYKRYGNWADACSVYNSGQPLANAPASTRQYVQKILGGQVAGAMVDGGYGGISGLRKPSKPSAPSMGGRTIKLSGIPRRTYKIKLPTMPKSLLPKAYESYKIQAPSWSGVQRLNEPVMPKVGPFNIKIPEISQPKVKLSFKLGGR